MLVCQIAIPVVTLNTKNTVEKRGMKETLCVFGVALIKFLCRNFLSRDIALYILGIYSEIKMHPLSPSDFSWTTHSLAFLKVLHVIWHLPISRYPIPHCD